MVVSWNSGIPPSIFIGFSIINQAFGGTPISRKPPYMSGKLCLPYVSSFKPLKTNGQPWYPSDMSGYEPVDISDGERDQRGPGGHGSGHRHENIKVKVFSSLMCFCCSWLMVSACFSPIFQSQVDHLELSIQDGGLLICMVYWRL